MIKYQFPSMLPDGWRIVVASTHSIDKPPAAKSVTPLVPSVSKAMYDAQRRDRRLGAREQPWSRKASPLKEVDTVSRHRADVPVQDSEIKQRG
jgi:hypothetical protein